MILVFIYDHQSSLSYGDYFSLAALIDVR